MDYQPASTDGFVRVSLASECLEWAAHTLPPTCAGAVAAQRLPAVRTKACGYDPSSLGMEPIRALSHAVPALLGLPAPDPAAYAPVSFGHGFVL